MLTNEELKEKFVKVHPEYISLDEKGKYKWKTARIYTTVLYDNESPILDGDGEKFRRFGVPCSLSPPHDKDVNDDGEIKKTHYHLVAYYKGKTTPYAFYNALCEGFGENSFSTIEIGKDISALIQYSCHLNETDEKKYKYDTADIKDFNGFDHYKYLFSGCDFMNVKGLLKEIIKNNNMIFFSELDDFLEENDNYLYQCLSRDKNLESWVMSYMRSREHELFYNGGVEKGYTRIKMENGTEKVIFNRQIKAVNE